MIWAIMWSVPILIATRLNGERPDSQRTKGAAIAIPRMEGRGLRSP
jgi:hypothetical protein